MRFLRPRLAMPPASSKDLTGWRHVANLPLVVGVSLDEKEMLAPWYREVSAS
jgi:hypothetical protein